MTDVRIQSRNERREQILSEAARIVSERGYHGFGIQELAQRCGLTKPGLLHHFPSKDQLLIALLRDRDRRDEIAVAAATDAGLAPECEPPSLAVVLGSLHAIVERNCAQPELVRLYAMLRAEALSPDHPAHSFFNAREAATLELFAQMVSGHVDHPRSVARALAALMTGLELQWLREDRGFDLLAEWDRAVATILR